MNVLSTKPLKIYCNLGKIQVQNCSFNIAQGEGEAKNLEQKNVSYPWDQVCWFVFDASCILPDQKCTTIYYFASSERLWKPGMDYFSYKTIWFDQLSW